MKFFIDTADVDEIAALVQSGMIDGVTTNPSLIAKTGRDYLEVIADICRLVDGPVSAEVTAEDRDAMVAEGHRLHAVDRKVCIKVPLSPEGLKACRHLSGEGIPVNVTLCFTPAQAILAAKAGASYVSPFVGRIDDVGRDGMGLVEDIVSIYANYRAFRTEVLVASVRHPMHVVDAARIGAHVVTVPPEVLYKMYAHPLTTKGLKDFLDDWSQTGRSILGDEP